MERKAIVLQRLHSPGIPSDTSYNNQHLRFYTKCSTHSLRITNGLNDKLKECIEVLPPPIDLSMPLRIFINSVLHGVQNGSAKLIGHG